MIKFILTNYFYLIVFLVIISMILGIAQPMINLVVKLFCKILKKGSTIFTSIKEELK